MIKKLRRSFVRVTMISAALVLVILMGLVNLLNYNQRDSADRAILAILAENGGYFPQNSRGLKGGRGQSVSASAVYEARYFTVLLGRDGTLFYADNSEAAWIDVAEAAAMAQALLASGETSGNYGDYKYLAADHGGEVMYIFLASSQNMAAVQAFFTDSAIVTAAGLVALFAAAWALSGRAVRPIAESYEKQKTFITNAGHELKTPLAVIESSTEVLEIENGESQWTRSIHNQVGRLANLTQELIALSRMDEGRQTLPMAELDASEIVADALEPYGPMAERRGLAFSADIAQGVRLRTNRDALEKICAILADNAVKYTADGGEIRFSFTQEGGRAILRGENPADGLTEGKQERLFERFYRGDKSRSSAQPGYGLGLPLARSLAEAMGGRMQAHSPDGKRFVVIVQLP